MRSKTIIFSLTLAIIITSIVNLFAEPNMKVNLQNMHLWRGMEVTDGLVITTDVSVSNPSESITAGVWGGMNTSGSYKEFDYYIQYSGDHLTISLWDIYNFSPNANYNNKEIFNYKANESGRFIDATVAYTVSDKFPLKLRWSTIIFGRDRDSDNESNKYSTFCYVEYPIYKFNRWTCDIGVGGAFALNCKDGSSHFYGNRAGVIETTAKLTYDLEIRNYSMPVSARAMWNPQDDNGFLQLSVQLFSF